MVEAPTGFVADAALRIDAPQTRSRALGRHTAAILLALSLELGAFALIWFERSYAPAPPLQEIPVEIVTEPPPPPPPPPAPELQSQQEYEKPATDAPREGKSDHDDEHVAEKEKPAKAEPPPPQPTPSPEASTPAEAAAPELPQAAEAEAPPPVKAEPTATPAPAPKPSVLAALPKTFENVPDVDFGGVAIKSPVTGGNAKSTYLSILYGLIVPKLHVPSLAHLYGRRLTGAIGLQVDGRGRLTARFVVEGSGSPELDEAAMKAVAEASREFPPPPRHAPMGMKFTYSVE
jgi:protein TonB